MELCGVCACCIYDREISTRLSSSSPEPMSLVNLLIVSPINTREVANERVLSSGAHLFPFRKHDSPFFCTSSDAMSSFN